MPLLFVALGLFGVVAALFGPVKYAMLPDQLAVGELATGNALVEGATFMAILIGTIAGGLFVSGSSHMGWVSLRRRRAGVAVLGLCLAHSGDGALGRRSSDHRQSMDLDRRPAEVALSPSRGFGMA